LAFRPQTTEKNKENPVLEYTIPEENIEPSYTQKTTPFFDDPNENIALG
jgi:hypothetical protein